MRFADAAGIDAVTVDAFGTLVVLEDPAERLHRALERHGIERTHTEVAAAFRVEAAHYRPRSLRGQDAASLTELREECAGVFLEHLGVQLEAAVFVPAFMASLVFRAADGAVVALERLHSAGLALACVANWDIGLHEHLDRLALGRYFETVVTSAEAGAEKPDPAILLEALGRLGVRSDRTLHVGDEDADRKGALAAGLGFEPVPLATVPERIGL
jgi:putative hydrolase of the HAD superfamily